MVGYTTALNDNPQLTARHHKGRQPLRVALDRNQSLPHSHHLFNDESPTWLINEKDETMMGNVHYIRVPFSDLLPGLLSRLYDARVLSVIVEGGAQLLHSFIERGLWDEARVFTGSAGIGAGVKAPQLQQEESAYATKHGNDDLQVFTNRQSDYVYIPGMEL